MQLKELRVSPVKYQISWKNPKLLGQKVRDLRIGIISETFLGINFFSPCQKEKYGSPVLLI